MDLRIVNTCNNDCSYCLEQSLRKKEFFLEKAFICDLLKKEKNKKVLNFFWGNPLLHPGLLELIKYAKNIWFENIWLLTNSFWVDKEKIIELKKIGLNSFWVYFNSFEEDKHNLIVWKTWIKLYKLLENIEFIKNNNFFIKIIIHVNKQNIETIYKDILILNKKYGINNFEFINYFPFDRPYNKYKNILEYSVFKNRTNINNIFKIIKKLQINVNFVKFSKDFFWEYKNFYIFEIGILKQIWDEDVERLGSEKKPFCLIEKRCKHCFLKDKCIWYEK